MNRPYASAAPVIGPDRDPYGATDTRLTGRRLILARAAWVAVAILALGLILAGIPLHFAQLRSVCADATCIDWQLSPDGLWELQDLGFSLDLYAAYVVALQAGSAAVWAGVAAIIFRYRSDQRMALFAAFFLLTFGVTTSNALLTAPAIDHPTWWAPTVLVQVLGVVSFGFFPYLFPDGRFVPRRTRWLAVGWVAWQVPGYFFPGSVVDVDTWYPPLTLLVMLAFFGTAIFAQVRRYRLVSDPRKRQQTKWVVFGLAAALVGFLTVLALGDLMLPGKTQTGSLGRLIGNTGIYCSMLFIPISIGVAILRYRLFDIDILINRTLVYGTLTACVVGIYVLVVGGLGTILEARGNLLVSLVAAGSVAALFMSLRDRLQRGVNRLMYGERDEPYRVLSRLGQRLEETLEPHAVLPTVAEAVAHALKLPHVAIELKRGDGYETAAECGRPVSEPLRLPLVYGTETVGRIVLSPRTPGEPFGPADRRLLDDLARQAGVAAHAVRLTADLQRSRERLVTAREEERRRLRRDLHDGLGPALSSAMLKLGAARRLLSPDSPADDLIVEVRDDVRATVAAVRRLVYDLRPPALDQLGLVPAIRDYAEQCGDRSASDGEAGLRVAVDVPKHLPPLPAAVEVAAYRIVREALTNVARHARASSCRVHLALEDTPERPELRLEIADDGVGLPAEHRAGVGLSSMRERAEELGGACAVGSFPGGGTRVLARLPVGKE